MFDVLCDPAIYEFENSPPESLPWLAERYRKLESRRSPDGRQCWLNWVIRLPGGALAGYVQATITEDGVAHVAYELASRYWRQGIGSAAVKAMMTELARHFGVSRCAATLKVCNFRSRALLTKLGFELTSPDDGEEITMGRRLGES